MKTTNCSWDTEVAAWVAGELPPGERAEFERHLAECAACRAAVESTRRVAERLLADPAPGVERDLAPAILARLSAKPANILQNGRGWRRMAAAAAAAVLLSGGALLVYFKRGPDESEQGAIAGGAALPEGTASTTNIDAANVSRALDWFCTRQEVDGSWEPAKWGGNRQFRPALTALPLMALLKGSSNEEHLAAADRALAFLRREQNGDGSFGRGNYNHGIATLAVLHALQAKPGVEGELRQSAAAALQVALRRQMAAGGWGDAINPEVPVTLWHREVLDLAVRLGWREAAPALSKADQWLASQAAPSGPDDALVADTGYLDSYFAVVKLHREATPEAAVHLDAIRRRLMASQSLTGDHSGSWEPTDQWSRAGGRIYATALASLALR